MAADRRVEGRVIEDDHGVDFLPLAALLAEFRGRGNGILGGSVCEGGQIMFEQPAGPILEPLGVTLDFFSVLAQEPRGEPLDLPFKAAYHLDPPRPIQNSTVLALHGPYTDHTRDCP